MIHQYDLNIAIVFLECLNTPGAVTETAKMKNIISKVVSSSDAVGLKIL